MVWLLAYPHKNHGIVNLTWRCHILPYGPGVYVGYI